MIAERYFIAIRIDQRDGTTEYYDGCTFGATLFETDHGPAVELFDAPPDAQEVVDAWKAEAGVHLTHYRYEVKSLRFVLEDV